MANRSIKSYVYEGSVIVTSILIAFALDATWANYQDARTEKRVLKELHAEFVSAKTRIIESIGELEGVISASAELSKHLGPQTAILPPQSVEDLLSRIVYLNTLEVPSSVLDSIIATGQLRLIANDEVRKELSEWPALVADVRENHEWHRTETDEYLVPYLSKYTSIRNWVARSNLLCCGASTFDFDASVMQHDPVFEGRLSHRVSRQVATLYESRILLDAAIEIIALIDRELQ